LTLIYKGFLVIPSDGIYYFRIGSEHPFDFEIGLNQMSSKISGEKVKTVVEAFPLRKGFHPFVVKQIVRNDDFLFYLDWSQDNESFKKIPERNFYCIDIKDPELLGEPAAKNPVQYVKLKEFPIQVPQGTIGSRTSIAVNSQGEIFLPDNANMQIFKFGPDGRILKKWGKYGRKPGELKMPSMIVSDSKDQLHVADRRNDRIQVFDSDGNYKRSYGEDMNDPTAICTHSNFKTIVTNTRFIEIMVFGPAGQLLRKFGKKGINNGEFIFPVGITSDKSGLLYILDSRQQNIQVFSHQGNFLRKWKVDIGFDHCSIAFTPANNIIIPDWSRKTVKVYSDKGTLYFGDIFPNHHFREPRAVTTDHQGRIYMLDDLKIVIFQETIIPPH